MLRLLSSFRSNEKGQSLVEFALILPIMLLILFGIIQFGFIFNGQITVTSAAREGARLGAVGGDNEAIREQVRSAAVALLLEDLEDEDIVINIDETNGRLTVQVNGTVPVIVPFINVFAGNEVAIVAEAVMRME